MITPDDRYYLQLARGQSKNSPDNSTKVGSVIVKDGRILSFGFNKLPNGFDSVPENRDEKLALVIHAEIVALVNSVESASGSTIYLWPFMSCSLCAGALSEAGITRVVAPFSRNPRWQKSFEKALEIFDKNNIEMDFAPEISQ